MGAHWKEPKEKNWYTFLANGKLIGICEDCNVMQKEISRVSGLAGVIVRPATKKELIKVNAKTVLPKRIINKMEYLARNAR
jgi:hypothetical protein